MVLKDGPVPFFSGLRVDHFEPTLEHSGLSTVRFPVKYVFFHQFPELSCLTSDPTPRPTTMEEQEDVAVPCVEKPRPSPSGNSVTWQFCP